MIVELPYPVPHEGQQKVLDQSKRFNIIRCGVRWGKTTLAEYLVKKATDNPLPIAYYCPTYKDLEPFWQVIKSDLGPIITEKSEAQKQIKTITGTTIDFWSLENPDSSRGRSYALAIIDEARKVRDLEYAWNQTIRGRLLDYSGTAWIISSPEGQGSFLNQMYVEGLTNPEWYCYTASTFENPYIQKAELEATRNTMTELAYQQEIMGEDIAWSGKPWCYAFTDNNITDAELSTLFNLRETVYLSFDFNVDPICATAHQLSKEPGKERYHTLFEWRIDNADTTELCNRIRSSPVGACYFLAYNLFWYLSHPSRFCVRALL